MMVLPCLCFKSARNMTPSLMLSTLLVGSSSRISGQPESKARASPMRGRSPMDSRPPCSPAGVLSPSGSACTSSSAEAIRSAAINSSSDALFTAVAEFKQWRKAGKEIKY